MANKRMFSKKIIDSDLFLDMPASAQNLYFHLSMRADDEGFIDNPKKITRMIGAGEDDIKILFAKQFLIPFDSGVVVIRHWRIHNTIQKDRFHPTIYTDEKSELVVTENGSYFKPNQRCIQNVSRMETQTSIDKTSIDKTSIDKISIEQDTMSGEPDRVPYKEIIEYFNEQTGSKYRATTPKTKSLIKSRWSEGFRVDDFKTVIDKKTDEWINDLKMKKYLRPETLFGTKFEGYLNQSEVVSQQTDSMRKLQQLYEEYSND